MKSSLFIALVCLLSLNCSSDDDSHTTCDDVTVLSEDDYHNAYSDEFTITSLEINNDCLEIIFNSAGCDGSTWELKLIDSESVDFSNPPQRNIILHLKNEEMCEALITKAITFDISNLQIEGHEVQLNITNSDQAILYEY